MIQRRKLSLTVALALLLGCGGSGDTKAQEKPGPDAKADDKGGPKAPEKADAKPAEPRTDKPAEDTHSYRATITDKSPDVKDYVVSDAVIWVPEVSILGGESHTVEKKLTVKKGALEITVPFADIAWIELGALKEDRLEVKVKRLSELKSEDPKVRELVLPGTVKSNLLLAGRYDDTTLAARLKLREVTKVALEPMPNKTEPTKAEPPK